MADSEFPIHHLLRERWSPVAFSPRPIAPAELACLFEAARWAPSSYNEQPWTFLLATRDQPDEFARMLQCLVPGNQIWAKHAFALVISCAQLSFARNGNANRHAFHDVGLATQNLLLQATALGIASHAMAGFDVDLARSAYQIPASHEPVAAIALGYLAADDDTSIDPSLRQRDARPRTRKPLSECVHSGAWGRNVRWG
jgi:nitroreductase